MAPTNIYVPGAPSIGKIRRRIGLGSASSIGLAFSFAFAGASSLPANTSFARASSATYFDSSGNLQTAATNAPRFTYDFFTKQPIGLLVEGSVANQIPNNTMVGAVAGTARTISGITGLSRTASANAVLLCTTSNAAVGDLITISNVSPASYNGTWVVVSAVANTSVTFSTSTSTTDTANGAITVAAVSQGTLPSSGWSIAGTAGLSYSVVSVSTPRNINCIDIRIAGITSSAAATKIYYGVTNNIAAYTWNLSNFLAIVGGSTANLTNISQDLDLRNASNVFIASTTTSNNIVSNIAQTNLLRFSDAVNGTVSAAVFNTPILTITPSGSGVVVDVTIRIGMPQLEALKLSSVIPTTNAAVTRAADFPQFTGAVAALLASSNYSVVVDVDSFSNTNAAFISANGASYIGLGYNGAITTSNGAGVSQLSVAQTAGSSTRTVVGLSTSPTGRILTSNGGSIRGGASTSDATTLPLGTFIGTDSTANYAIYGTVRSITIYNTALTQAQLEAATNLVNTVAWGDSLTYGTGSYSPGVNYGYVTNLERLAALAIVDKGVGGETSSQIATRQLADTIFVNDNAIFEAGRNNIGNTPASIVANFQSMINHLTVGNSRYVVVSIINATAENSAASGANLTNYNNILAINAALAAAFPGHYLDWRAALVTASGGANDAPAATFMYNGSVHPNDAGYQVLATALKTFGYQNNWPGFGNSDVVTANTVLASTVAGTSLIQAPDDFTHFSWGSVAATTLGGQGTALDGTNNLSTIIDNATNSRHIFYQNGLNPNAAGLYTFTCYLKQNTLRYAQLQIADANNSNASFGAIFDTLSGVVTDTKTVGSPTGISAKMQPTSVAGLYLCTVTMNVLAGTLNVYGVIATSNSATPTYDANGNPTYAGTSQSIFAWDASLSYPISIGNAKVPPAQPWITAGYLKNTFHAGTFSAANIDTGLTRAPGKQFYLTGSFGYADTDPSHLTFNSDGSVTLVGSGTGVQGCALYSVAAKGTPATNWHGSAFGGGAYFEATLSFDPTPINSANGANGFPAWWADPVEHAAEQSISSDNWVGQAPGFVHFTELDFFEYNVWGNQNRLFQYNGTVIDWSGVYNGSTYPVNLQNAFNRLITLPVGVDFTKPHRYGFLWVPATSGTQGYFQWYFDGLPTSDRVYYSFYDPANVPSPPATTSSPWLYGVADTQHYELILNTNTTDNLRVYSVDVWQASAAGNIVK